MMNDQSPDQSWHVTQRWQQYEGEARANLLRILAIGTFYLLHLWNYFSSQGKLPGLSSLKLAPQGEITDRFHLQVTLLALAWIMLAAGVHIALQSRVFPKWLPALTILGDVLFLTCVLCISDGPRSPLIVGYFLIIALSTLRFDLPLVRFATLATMLGYLAVLGCAKWPATFGRPPDVDLKVSRFQQLVILAALALTGIILGQVIRRVRQFAEDYATRTSATGGPQS